MKMRHLLFTLFASLLIVAVPLGVSAATSEQITNFDVDATLSSDSTLSVIENIDYDFGAAARHGIYRDIPLVYTDDKGQEFRPKVEFTSATQDGSAAKVSESRGNSALSLKLGDAGRTITGLHRYQIRYELHPIMQPGDGRDVLKFNVTGNGWNVPIMFASIHVTFPDGVTPLAANCFTGAAGSKNANCTGRLVVQRNCRQVVE